MPTFAVVSCLSALPALTPAPVLIKGHVQDPMQAVLGPRSQFRHLTDPHTCATVSHMPTTDALSALSAYSAVGPSPYQSATCAPCPYSIRVPTHRRRACPAGVQQMSSKCRTSSPSPAMKITKTSTDWTHLENFPSSSARHCLTSPSPARSPEASQCQNAIALAALLTVTLGLTYSRLAVSARDC